MKDNVAALVYPHQLSDYRLVDAIAFLAVTCIAPTLGVCS